MEAVDHDELLTKVFAKDIIDEETGEVLVECNEDVTDERLDQLADASA